ncbi:MAG TPA: prenyltransferase/squalene oxidase repeat-containing protein [Gemmata sp.]
MHTETISERDAAWFEELAGAVRRGRAALVAHQHADGHWGGAVESDEPLEAELIFLLAFLGELADPRVPLAAKRLLERSRPDSRDDLGAAVRTYFALKIAGHAAHEPHMTRAAEAIRAAGGAASADPLTRAWLALLGQLPYSACAPEPVQAVLLPKWLGGIGAAPEWDRAGRIAWGIVRAHETVTHLPAALGASELFVRPLPAQKTNGLRPFRARALRAATSWLRARCAEGGPDSGFRALAFATVALKALGAPPTDPEARRVRAQLEHLCPVEGGRLRVQPFRAPVRDTALSLIALAEAAPARVADRLLERGARAAPLPRDTETTARVLVALARAGGSMSAASSELAYPALNRLLAAQNRDGGWPAFDRATSADPSCPALTACALEALGHFGFRPGQPPVDAATRFVLERQEISGPWRTRWGGSALQTTWQVFAGLRAVGSDMCGLPVRRAVRWLKESQNADASWGRATPSETAWAVLALLEAGEAGSAEARAGAEFLAGTQRRDGTWVERGFTAAGFAPGSKLKCELGALHFPLLALGRYASEYGQPEPRSGLTRADAGHAVAGPKGHRHTLAEM